MLSPALDTLGNPGAVPLDSTLRQYSVCRLKMRGANAGEPGPVPCLPSDKYLACLPATKACLLHKDYDLPLLEIALKILGRPKGQG